jgi:tetratricopeptide (TPR) repeat protein
MRSRFLAAVMMAGLFAGTVAFVPHSAVVAQEAPKVSKVAAKPLKAAQDAMNAKKYQEALTRLKEVQALPGKTAYDEHVTNELLGYVYARTKNLPESAKALEAGLNSGFLKKDDVPGRVKALATMYYQLKDYDKAIEYGNRAIKGGYANDEMYTFIGQAYYQKRDYKGTLKFVNSWVDGQIKAGKTPKEASMKMIMASCAALEDSECQTRAMERTVAYYPKDEYWQTLLHSMFRSTNSTDPNLLHVYRLASEVDALQRPSDYTEMAQLALEQGSPGEAQRILEKGFTKKVFTEQRDKDRNQRLLDSAKKQVAANQAALAKVEKEAAAAATGDKDVGVGVALLGYQQYPKAIEAFNRAISKKAVKNVAEAQLLLGVAQLKAGKKDDAVKTFKAVKGDATLERLANLWSLHARKA